jgi:cytidylate kinase
MDVQGDIALMGRAGAGTTSVADLLVREYGYHRCTPGDICRQVCALIFGKQERSLRNRVTEQLKPLDKLCPGRK